MSKFQKDERQIPLSFDSETSHLFNRSSASSNVVQVEFNCRLKVPDGKLEESSDTKIIADILKEAKRLSW